MLYLVSTPIGNLEDITFRAIHVLQEVDYILCEDTRQAGKLMKHYGITTNLKVYHAQNHHKVGAHILEELLAGKTIALISDAGTPLISDPGILLVKEAIQKGIQIIPIPGASALLSGLVISGCDTNQFEFLGFVPHKKGRHTLFQSIAEKQHTVVFYESTHRILKTLEQLVEFCPHKYIAVGRELTKMFEECVRGTPEEVFEHFKNNPTKGEFVVVVN